MPVISISPLLTSPSFGNSFRFLCRTSALMAASLCPRSTITSFNFIVILLFRLCGIFGIQSSPEWPASAEPNRMSWPIKVSQKGLPVNRKTAQSFDFVQGRPLSRLFVLLSTVYQLPVIYQRFLAPKLGRREPPNLPRPPKLRRPEKLLPNDGRSCSSANPSTFFFGRTLLRSRSMALTSSF